MITIYDSIERAITGRACPVKEYDLKLLPRKLKELVSEYHISYDPGIVVPSDDSLADAVFEAALRLSAELGAVCTSTDRLINFTEEELKESMRELPEQVTFGDGKDAVVVKPRRIEDNNRPILYGGPCGAILSEDIYIECHTSYVKEPEIDCLNAGTLATFKGQVVRTGTPLEVSLARYEGRLKREAAARAGRPGIRIGGVMSAITDRATLAAFSETGWHRRTDNLGNAMISELKVDYGSLTKAIHAHEHGCHSGLLYAPIVYGYGPPAQIAVLMTAGIILGHAIYHPSSVILHPVNMMHQGTTSCRECMWVESIASQAATRNSHMLFQSNIFTAAGTCTEQILYEIAANTIAPTVSGSHMGNLVASANGIVQDHVSGLDAKFSGEVARATCASSIKRDEANEIVIKLLRRYEDKIDNPPLGKKFQECYHLDTITPTDEWRNIYNDGKKEVAALGLDFEYQAIS